MRCVPKIIDGVEKLTVYSPFSRPVNSYLPSAPVTVVSVVPSGFVNVTVTPSIPTSLEFWMPSLLLSSHT